MDYLLTPQEATIWFLLFDSLGWLLLFLYDHYTERRILPYVNSLRLVKSGCVTVGISYLYYNYVPGATHIYFLLAHAIFFVMYPALLFYPRRSARIFRIGTATGLAVLVSGIVVLCREGHPWHYSAIFYAVLVPIVSIYFGTGGRYVIMRYYYKVPFWH